MDGILECLSGRQNDSKGKPIDSCRSHKDDCPARSPPDEEFRLYAQLLDRRGNGWR